VPNRVIFEPCTGKYPRANFVLVDLARKKCCGRWRAHASGINSDQFQYVLSDYRKLEGKQDYRPGHLRLSIHHLDAMRKNRSYLAVSHTILRKGGIFINVRSDSGQHVLFAGSLLESLAGTGAGSRVPRRAHPRKHRPATTYDREALLENQLEWLNKQWVPGMWIAFIRISLCGVFLGDEAGDADV